MTLRRFQMVSILLGTIIGAGFASGQEILAFFIRYGKTGIYCLILSGVLWILSLTALFYVLRKDQIHSYPQLAEILFGHEICRVYQILVTVFLFLSLSIMFSGAGTLVYEQWKIPGFYGSLIMAFAVYITLRYDLRGFSLMNQILAPLLVTGICIASLLIIYRTCVPSSSLSLQPILTLDVRQSVVFQALFHMLLYVSYNLISVIVICCGIQIPYPRHTAVITGLSLTLLSLSLGVATFINYGTIIEIEIPIPALLSRFTRVRWGYVLLLFLAMYTTAIGNTYGILQSVHVRKQQGLLLIIIGAVLVSNLGFSVLIEKGYTFFGYIGLLQLLLLFRRAVCYLRIDSHK